MDVLAIPRQILRAQWRIVRLPYTVLKEMRSHGVEVPEVRRAFVEDMSGRAKATAGFVLGDDRLLERGQVERVKAAQRLTAVAEEAAADATEGRARRKLAEQLTEARRQREDASRDHALRAQSIASERRAEKRKIETDSARARNAVNRKAVGEQRSVEARDEAHKTEVAVEIVAAVEEETAARAARDQADAVDRARRSAR